MSSRPSRHCSAPPLEPRTHGRDLHEENPYFCSQEIDTPAPGQLDDDLEVWWTTIGASPRKTPQREVAREPISTYPNANICCWRR